jgi:calmodulin
MPIKDENDPQHEIDTEDLGHVLRSVGYNPTRSQLNSMINQLDPNGKGSIDWQKFLTSMKDKKNLPKQAVGDLLDSIGPKNKNYNNYSDLNTTDSKHPFAQKR